jgi:hypothetical protein
MRVRACCACLLLSARVCLVLLGLVSCTCAWVYVYREEHVSARMMRLPTLECTRAVGVAWPCVYHARVGVFVEGSTTACMDVARASFRFLE